MREMTIGKVVIGDHHPPFIIAEAGVNHNGCFDTALALIEAASKVGADAIKFQTFRAEQVVTAAGRMADYQKRNSGSEASQLAMLRELELKEEWYPELIKFAQARGIIFLSTPHGGLQSVDLLASFDIPAFKFGSGDLTNLPLLEYAAKYNKPMLISTGMANFQEVKEAVDTIKQAGNDQILVFHCTTDYPCAHAFVNLRTMETFRKAFHTVVGYSDHTIGYQASALAVALGACMIEKHLSLDRNMKGPDHLASTEPKAFQEMVAILKKIPRDFQAAIKMLSLSEKEAEILMGSADKKPLPPELQYIKQVRKSIVTARAIKSGETFTSENLTIKRPGDGMLPKYLHQVFGKTASSDIPEDVLLDEQMISASISS